MNTRDLNFLFLSLCAFLFRCWFRTIKSARLSRFFPSCWFLSFVFGKRGGLSPSQHEDDDDDVNENDDWVCKNNDYCFHPDIIIVIVFVAKEKFKDHLRAGAIASAVVRVLPR